MDLEARKINFVQEFLRLESEEIIGDLEKILIKTKTDLYEKNLRPMSIEQFNAEIEQSMNDSKNGRLIKASDLKEKIKKWS
nr:hypothetical protein [Pseudopedobacter sp.]